MFDRARLLVIVIVIVVVVAAAVVVVVVVVVVVTSAAVVSVGLCLQRDDFRQSSVLFVSEISSWW